MRRLLALLLGSASIAGCGQRDSSGTAAELRALENAERIARETARLDTWLDARYEEQLDWSPILKTMLGRKDDYAELDDLSESAHDAQLEWQRRSVEDLQRGFDHALLTPEAKTSVELWTYALEQAEAALPFRRRAYLFEQMSGAHTDLPHLLINYHRVDEDADMVAYIARIGEAARAIDQSLERAELAAQEGVHAPRFAYEAVREQARAVVTGTPFAGDGDSPLWTDATAKIDALAASGKVDASRAAALRAALATALTERLGPAYDALLAWVDAELPKTSELATGVWALPDGPAYYEERLAAATTTKISADEIHALGLSEVARIHAEMEAIKKKVAFSGSLQEFFEFVREDRQFYFPNTDEGREAYLQHARDHLAFIQQRLPDYFGLLPKASLIVKRVEGFRELSGGAQHYDQATPDGSRPGVYYVHLIDMASMSKTEMEYVAYHEGNPGHHMQVSIAQELSGLPTFRTQIDFTAYVEGWALYAELLGKEMGGYQDPYSDFGRLAGEIWRAIRLVVDTGLHAKRWSEAEAVAYFIANSPASEGQVRPEIQRYIVWPGQATAYTIGMRKIRELRAKAEAALGEDFDIRGFHDSVLGGGALPLSILERRVDEWIAATSG